MKRTQVSKLNKVSAFFYKDERGTRYFCVGDYVRTTNLPDTPVMRRIVREEVHAMAPGMPIVDEVTAREESADVDAYDA
jgi:hypothetical protein